MEICIERAKFEIAPQKRVGNGFDGPFPTLF